MTSGLVEHYRAVLADLQGQHKKLSAELADIEFAMAAIGRRLGNASTQLASAPVQADRQAGKLEAAINYANISVRWAVLALLAEVADGPMGTGAIAEALQARGVVKEGPSRFGNIVSAVISNLKTKGEVESVDGLYQLTDPGRTMWAHIKAGSKFRLSQSAVAQERDLLQEPE